MCHIKKLIRSCDQFGAISQITFLNNDVKFQTLYGGILSMLLYSLGFFYLFYEIFIWQTYQIPPFYMSQMSFNPDIKFNLTKPLFVFGLVNPSLNDESTNHRMDSISKKGYYYNLNIWDEQGDDMKHNDPGYQCIVTKNESYLFDPICVNLQDENQITLQTDYLNPDKTWDTFYTIERCNQANDTKTEKCLGEKDQLDLNKNTKWKLTLFTQDVDIKTGKTTNIEQNNYYWNNVINSTFLFTLNIRKATYIIDRGIIFSDLQIVEVVRSISIVKDKGNFTVFGDNQHEFAQINYRLDNEEEIIRVTYPKLGAILAQVFSIFQLLLLSGLIMNMFNKRVMDFNIEQALLKIYFPQIKLFKFKHDWRGKIHSILFKNKILQNDDFKKVKQFRETRGMQLRGKLNSTNILFEISRIQLHLQSKIPIQEYVKMDGLGYKMNLPHTLSEQILLDDQNQFIDYHDLNVINQKHKIDNEEVYFIKHYHRSNLLPNIHMEAKPIEQQDILVIQDQIIITEKNDVYPVNPLQTIQENEKQDYMNE